MLSIIICACLNKPERRVYLDKCLASLKKTFVQAFPDIEIIVSFDKYGAEIDGIKCYTHECGMGHSWNWAIQNAKYEWILQIEDDWDFILKPPHVLSAQDLYNFIQKEIVVLKKFGGIYSFDNRASSAFDWYSSGYTEMTIDDFAFCELNRPISVPKWGADFNMYYYANHPHLKHKELQGKIGWYLENVPPHIVEEKMCKMFYESQERVFFNKFSLFRHIGEISARPKPTIIRQNHLLKS